MPDYGDRPRDEDDCAIARALADELVPQRRCVRRLVEVMNIIDDECEGFVLLFLVRKQGAQRGLLRGPVVQPVERLARAARRNPIHSGA